MKHNVNCVPVVVLAFSLLATNGFGAKHVERRQNMRRQLQRAKVGRSNALARKIKNTIPGVVTIVPKRCSKWKRPQAVYVTHANADDKTLTGVEPFWEEMYHEIEDISVMVDVCFVFTGYDAAAGSDVPTVLTATLDFVSQQRVVASIIASDPTEGTRVVDTVRMISDSAMLPTIGMFNAGYGNILAESSSSDEPPIPFIGPIFNEEFGAVAADASGPSDVAICLNHRFGVLDLIRERCERFFKSLGFAASEGTKCSEAEEGGSVFSVEQMESIIGEAIAANPGAQTVAIYSEGECCENAAAAVANISRMENARELNIVVTCADANALTEGLLRRGNIEVIATQPVQLQAYTAATWTSNSVQKASKRPYNTKGEGEFFPSTTSVVNTGIYAVSRPS